jgi:hypothetical protein
LDRKIAGRSGQIFSVDFVLSVFVFVICLAFITAYWQNTVLSANQSAERNRLTYTALTAANVLLSGSGEPEGWESDASSIQTLGIARQGAQNEIDKAKLANFTALPDKTVRALLGLSNTRMQYHFILDGVTSAVGYESGNSSYGAMTAGVTRYAILDGEIVRVRFFVHQ